MVNPPLVGINLDSNDLVDGSLNGSLRGTFLIDEVLVDDLLGDNPFDGRPFVSAVLVNKVIIN